MGLFALLGSFAALKLVLGLYLSYKVFSFTRFYIHARRAGFPILASPVFSKSVLFLALAPALQPLSKKYLPNWVYERIEPFTHGWEFRGKRMYTDRYGKVFTMVSPDECTLVIADPVLGNVVANRKNDFHQAPIIAKFLGFLGPNIFTVIGDTWKRHRRLFAANLDERISRVVWTESCQQADIMRNYMVDRSGHETLEGLRSLAVNVIGQAGYSQKQTWSPQLRELGLEATSERTAYFSTLSMIANNFIQAALIPTAILRLPIMPQSIRTLAYHMQRIPEYTSSVLDEERKIAENEGAPRNNFLSLLLRLSDEEKRSKTGFSLTDEEISGNLFVFTTAGFETTANTMGYTVAFLAAQPEYQDWVREELQHLDPDPTTWAYDDVFPKCKRTLALMLETLRHFPPVVHTMRAIMEPQQLVSDAGTHSLLPPMDIFISQFFIHMDPEYWGPDPEVFRPTRWLDDAGQLITPAQGTFIPWSEGARVCPGMKMSQVEFVATMATLFRSSKCEVVPTGDLHRTEDLQQRLKDLMANSISTLTLQFRDPKEVQLRWVQA